MVPKVTYVKAPEKYFIHVLFEDGTEGAYDVSHLAGRGVFKAWDRDDNFFLVSVDPESGAITWPGGLDIDTVNVYCTLKNISVDELKNSLQSHAAN